MGVRKAEQLNMEQHLAIIGGVLFYALRGPPRPQAATAAAEGVIMPPLRSCNMETL